MVQGLQDYLAEVGGVPWVIGGDWDLELDILEDRGTKSGKCRSPTSWDLRRNSGAVSTGTSPASGCRYLVQGQRLFRAQTTYASPSPWARRAMGPWASACIAPHRFQPRRLQGQAAAGSDEWGTEHKPQVRDSDGYMGKKGPTRRSKGCYARSAYKYKRVTFTQGGGVKYSPQRITYTQDGKFGVGTNRAMQNARLKAARQGRYQLLKQAGSSTHEQEDLWWPLGGTGPDAVQRRVLDNWLEAARKRRNRDWATRKQAQHKKSGGDIYSWAVRSKADDGYTSMKAAPAGAIHTIASRLQKAVDAWGALWDGGDAYEPTPSEALGPTTANDIMKVLKR